MQFKLPKTFGKLPQSGQSHSTNLDLRNVLLHNHNYFYLIKMAKKSSKGPTYYSALQICVALTFILVVFLTAKFSSVAILDVRPERLIPNHRNLLLKQQIFDIKSRHSFQSLKPFDYILDNQRVRINSDMDQFPFENNQELNDLITETGGKPIRAMVIKFIHLLSRA